MICSSVLLFNLEVSALKKMFSRNSYSYKFFDSVYSNFLRISNANDCSTIVDDKSEDDSIPTVILRVPYFGKCSTIFSRSLTSFISNHYNVC